MSGIDWLNHKSQEWPRNSNKALLRGIILLATVCLFLNLGYKANWTGFKKDTEITKVDEIISNGKKITVSTKDIPAKKFWDWMDLLLAPATLITLAALFQRMQDREKDQQEDRERDQARKIQRDNQSEEVLEAYFDNISKLLIDNKLIVLLRKQHEQIQLDVEEKNLLDTGLELIRARTSSVLSRLNTGAEVEQLISKFNESLDGMEELIKVESDTELKKIQGNLKRIQSELEDQVIKSRSCSGKADVLFFLCELGLLKKSGNNDTLDLKAADFSGVNLSKFNLTQVNLQCVNLQGANLERAYIHNANLKGSDLRGVNFERAQMQSAGSNDPYRTNLERTDLRGANLKFANLSKVNLRGADLKYASFEGANLEDADFRKGGHLKRYVSDLSHATGLVKEQIEKAKLCGTILPTNLRGVLDSNKDCET